MKDRVITVRLEDASTDSVRESRWLATTTIGGKTDVQLQAVYVQLKPKTMVPKPRAKRANRNPATAVLKATVKAGMNKCHHRLMLSLRHCEIWR